MPPGALASPGGFLASHAIWSAVGLSTLLDSCHGGSPPRRRGVVAVIARRGALLAVRRSDLVAAPGKICFPGGGIEPGETESQALIREIHEELGVRVVPVRPLWYSATPWRVTLAWWHAESDPDAQWLPNPQEVAEVFWRTPEELLAHSDLLDSNREFLHALQRGTIAFPGWTTLY